MHFPEILKKCKRGPQVILPKDRGVILAYSGVGKNSVVVDAGAGSGWLAISLANVAKKVTSYEWREEFAELADVHRTYVGMLERAEKSPTLGTVAAWAKAFGLRPSELLREVGL